MFGYPGLSSLRQAYYAGQYLTARYIHVAHVVKASKKVLVVERCLLLVVPLLFPHIVSVMNITCHNTDERRVHFDLALN
jgi:hypothetical protein